MNGNNKRGYSKRNSNDPIVGEPKSVRLRESHHARVAAILEGTSFNGLVGDLFESRFRLEDFYKKAPNIDLDYNDVILIVGKEIESDDVSRSILAWIGGAPLPDIKISPKGSDFFDTFFDSEDRRDSFAELRERLFVLVDAAAEDYFDEGLITLTFYKLAYVIRDAPRISKSEKLFAMDCAEGLVSAARDRLKSKALFWMDLRFAVYACWSLMCERQVTYPEALADAERTLIEAYGHKPIFFKVA